MSRDKAGLLAVVFGVCAIVTGLAHSDVGAAVTDAWAPCGSSTAARAAVCGINCFLSHGLSKIDSNVQIAERLYGAFGSGDFHFPIPLYSVPEPRALWLLGIGLVVIAFRKKFLLKKSTADREHSKDGPFINREQ